MTGRNQIVGRKGEDDAAARLERMGYRILARNVRSPEGELDLIAEAGEYTVFIEVKARRGRSHGLPEESVTKTKKARLLAAAQRYLQERGRSDLPWRIDVAAVEYDPAGKIARFEVFENAVTGE
jgi:putative endonuclease